MGDTQENIKKFKQIIDQIIDDSAYGINIDPSCSNILLDLGHLFNKDDNKYIVAIPLQCIKNGCTVSFGNKRYEIDFNETYLGKKVRFILAGRRPKYSNKETVKTIFKGKEYTLVSGVEHDRKSNTDGFKIKSCNFEEMPDWFYIYEVNKESQIAIYEEDDQDNDIIQIYKERHKIKGDDDIIIVLLGIYLPNGYSKHPGAPCIVLFPKNIREIARELNNKNNLSLSDDDAYNGLRDFVKNHEYAHAFFDKEQKDHLINCDIFIEECLANYAALLSEKKSPTSLKMGKALVESQSSLNSFNPGYSFALNLFDQNFEPKLIGWWKWRYCCELLNGIDYSDLVNINDLAEIFDIKGLKFV